jgi:hypothetical protein
LLGSIVALNAGGDLGGAGSATLDRALVKDPRDFAYVDSGHSIIGEDPRLGPLADNGGPTLTMLPASNSPVIGRGSGFGVVSDQRGFPRPVDDADIGAIELTEAELAGPPQVGNSAQPTITGRPRVGETLHTDGGSWEPEDVSLTYQWLRDGEPITGATSASYTLTPQDFGRYWYGLDRRTRLAVQVTASAAGHRDGVMASDETGFVKKGFLVMSGRPRVTGRVNVGSVLRAWPRVSAVSPRRPREVTIAWLLDDRTVQSAYDRKRLPLQPRMRGKHVKVRFTYSPRGRVPAAHAGSGEAAPREVRGGGAAEALVGAVTP